MQNVVAIEKGGRRLPFKEFYSEDAASIWFFHDSVEILPKLAQSGRFTASTIVYISSSWHIESYKASLYAKTIDACQSVVGTGFDVAHNVVIIINSQAELNAVRNVVPRQTEVILVNNACLIDTNVFQILPSIEKQWDCVINAKPMKFKRHFLSTAIPRKLFITYDNAEFDKGNSKRVHLPDFNPAHVVSGLPEREVVRYLNGAKVGAIFSEEEGACYASIEYLLCGLPVVSTPSRGGRDEFYDEFTAIICEPEVDAVCNAVQRAVNMVDTGSFKPTVIRARTLDRIQQFRQTLIVSLKEKQARLGLNADLTAVFSDRIQNNSKLSAYRNFFLQDVAFE